MFGRIFVEPAKGGAETAELMIDATHLKAHQTAASLLSGGSSRHVGRTKGGLNPRLHAVRDSQGRPRSLFRTAGHVRNHRGAADLLATMPPAKALLADRGHEADMLRKALAKRRIEACIPSKLNRKIRIHHDRALYRKRHRIETHSESSRTGRVSPPAMTDAPRRARSVP